MSADTQRVALGRVGRAHGISGAFRVRPYADDLERFRRLRAIVLVRGPKVLAATVKSVQVANGFVIVQTDQITNPEDVRTWLGGDLEIDISERATPPPGQFFQDQIIGLRVETTDGQPVGIVEAIIDGPANDVYVCRAGEREFLIPAVDEFIKVIDPGAGRIVVAPIPGMLD